MRDRVDLAWSAVTPADRALRRFAAGVGACVVVCGGLGTLALAYWGVPVGQTAFVLGLTAPALCLYLSRTGQALLLLRRRPHLDCEPRRRPDSRGTAVVLPVIVRNEGDIAAIGRFVSHHLALLEGAADTLIVLADPVDGPATTMDEDERIRIDLERLKVEFGDDRLLVVWRVRRWSASENCWMGWERKRGKILDFCRLTAGQDAPDFQITRRTRERLRLIHSFIALDLDGRLAPGAAAELAACAEGDAAFVTPTLLPLPGARGSVFARLFYGPSPEEQDAITAPSFHRDVLDRPLYFGKGLIRIRPFLERVDGILPDGVVLSHDHLEGFLGRVQHCPGAVLLEDDPQSWSGWRDRQMRWVRGDIQALALAAASTCRLSEPVLARKIGFHGQLKLVSNLVSHTAPVGVSIAMVAIWGGWLGDTPPWLPWLLPLLLGSSPILVPGLGFLTRSPHTLSSARQAARTLRLSLSATLVRTALLVETSCLVAQAILQSLWGMANRKGLLQWRPAPGAWMLSLAALGLALLSALIVIRFNPDALPWAAPVLAAWSLSSIALLQGKIFRS